MNTGIVLVGALALTACVSTPAQDGFEVAWAESQRNEHESPAGREYDRVMAAWMGPALTRALFADCKAAAHTPGLGTVRFILQVNLDGTVRNSYVRPTDDRWECVRANLAGQHLPLPPRDGWWTGGPMRGMK